MKATTSTAGSIEVSYSLRRETFTGPIRHSEKTLTQRFNEAYDEEARREDEEFFKTTEEYYRRQFNAED